MDDIKYEVSSIVFFIIVEELHICHFRIATDETTYIDRRVFESAVNLSDHRAL